MKETAELPISTYLIQRLLIGLVVAVNLYALLYLIIGIHRLLAKGPEDLSGALSLIGGALGFYAIWKLAQHLITGDPAGGNTAPSARRPLMLLGHLLFWGFTLALWFVILPWCSQYNYTQGVAAKDKQRYAHAIDSLTRALYKESENVDAHYALADIYDDLANTEAAVRHYRMGIHSDPGFHPRAFNNLARLLLARNEAIAALDLLDLAEARIDKRPADEEGWAQHGFIRKNRAWAYWKLGLHAKAMEQILRAQQLLGSAHRLAEVPEVYCLHTLIARETGERSKSAEQACIGSYDTQPNGRRKKPGQSANTRPPQGASRELYLLVLKQKTED